MSQSKIKILVACHKPDIVYADNVYVPIHVGRAISKYKEEMADMIGDDTGDNISEKNPYYCELTAQYWAWKNLNSEYVGLCHYRRYFETKITEENIDKILGDKYDVLLVHPLYERQSVSTRLQKATCVEDVYIFYRCVMNLNPEYGELTCRFMKYNKFVPYNMFVMRKHLFESFAKWQFSVLEEMEKFVKLSGYTRCRRLYGYMAEIMLPIFCEKNNLKIKYDEWVPMVGEKNGTNKLKRKLRDYVVNMMYTFWKDSGVPDFQAIKVGLQMDGIYI